MNFLKNRKTAIADKNGSLTRDKRPKTRENSLTSTNKVSGLKSRGNSISNQNISRNTMYENNVNQS